ncbi:uncharacterized protein PG986_011362 [Apiospora aurea]|uniref:Uncharacterized protein n=1 Tax=Apiospora aurea TaxID=335848 RepID=A0ABR1Q4V2_9PEZI
MPDKKPFQNVVQTKAEALALDVAELFAPLDTPTSVVANHLTTLYERALRLKADLVLSNQSYTARFLPSKDPIDLAVVDIENDVGDRAVEPTKVKQCFFPIIYFKPNPEIDAVTTELSQCMVKYTNFAILDSRFGKPGDATMLYKGIVIA